MPCRLPARQWSATSRGRAGDWAVMFGSSVLLRASSMAPSGTASNWLTASQFFRYCAELWKASSCLDSARGSVDRTEVLSVPTVSHAFDKNRTSIGIGTYRIEGVE